jgi:hypothetical protein
MELAYSDRIKTPSRSPGISVGLTGCLAGANQRRLRAIILATAKEPRNSMTMQYHNAASFSLATEVQTRKTRRSRNWSWMTLAIIMGTLHPDEWNPTL